MSRFTTIEYWLDEHTVLVGDVALMPSSALEYDGFSVVTHIRNIDHDITAAFSDAQLDRFKGFFELHVNNKYLDDLKFKLNDELDDAI